jgi:hypothetical protein
MTRNVTVLAEQGPLVADILTVYQGEALTVRVVPNGQDIGTDVFFAVAETDGGPEILTVNGVRTVTIDSVQMETLTVGQTYFYYVWSSAALILTLVAKGQIVVQAASLPEGVTPAAPSITVQGSVEVVNTDTTASLTFTPPVVAGNPTPTVTRALTVDGVAGNTALVQTITKTAFSQVIQMVWTAVNGFGSPALSMVQTVISKIYGVQYAPPAGLGWGGPAFTAVETIDGFSVNLTPRNLVNAAIWTGAGIHVDPVSGDDSWTGLGSADGDFTNAKRSIHAAFTAGNATGAPYRVILKAGNYNGATFTNNGLVEPNQHVAIIGWDGIASYRTGTQTPSWANSGSGTYTFSVTSLNAVFRTDVLTAKGSFTRLTKAADQAACAATLNSYWWSGSVCHVNIGKAPSSSDIALIRGFNGARFLTHTSDLYLENLTIEGGITGALHCDAIATRNVVGLNCKIGYSAPTTVGQELDAVRVRRTIGLVAFFESDASGAAKDGWNFHDDGSVGMNVLLVNCTGHDNGDGNATSCNAFTTHDAVKACVIGGEFGHSRNGTEVHCIESTKTWLYGAQVEARDVDGTSTAFKCSTSSEMWLQDTIADAAGSAENYAIEANGGAVLKRNTVTIAGTELVTDGGSIGTF